MGFLNGDTTDEDQYLVVTSTDGGKTFSPPVRVDTLYDVNEPRGVNGRADCVARGQGSTRAVLTNTCFRADPIMNSIVADKRGGAFANDVYVVLDDNRNGTIRNSNNDVFFYKSTDGGTTWIGPTRVNNDPSTMPANRDCGRKTNSIARQLGELPGERNTGNDQFFPFISINQQGDLNVTFHDRRLDTTSPAGGGAWPTSKTEVGQLPRLVLGRAVLDHADRDGQPTATAGAGGRVAVRRAGGGRQPDGRDRIQPRRRADPGQRPELGDAAVPELPDLGLRRRTSTTRSGRGCSPATTAATRRARRDPNGDEKGGDQTAAFWTDARNGRGSGTPTTTQAGRNPICEQSDVFFDAFSPSGNGGGGSRQPKRLALLGHSCPDGDTGQGRGHRH